MESHLLQMRGLKPCGSCIICRKRKSHLLQMRGLKHNNYSKRGTTTRVASFTDAWIETRTAKPDEQLNTSRIFYRCVD